MLLDELGTDSYSLGAIGNRGNLTSVVAGTGATVTTSSAFDDAGAKESDTDANKQKTGYSTMCSDAYLQTVTYPLAVNGSSLQTTTNYDCSSGLVNSTKDMNQQQTLYSYYTSLPNLGRVETVTRPDGGTTTYTYPSSVETDQAATQSSSVTVTHESILDTYGRSYQSVTVAPEGSISSETYYDLTGRPYEVTTPHLTGTNATDGTAYTYYDVLGRTTKIKAPNGTATTTTYSGNTQTVTDALSNSVKYTYDAFHRLTKVLEPNSSGTLANETDYQYNALDKLTQVDQWGGANGATSPGDRQRVFSYNDILGRLISVTTPEGGTTTYSYLTNSAPCAGNVSLPCSKTDARGVKVQYIYDPLNRITSKSYLNDSTGTPTACFQYDASGVSGAGSNLLGRLTNQWTQSASAGSCNTSLPANGGYQTLRSMLSYDTMGRLWSEMQCTPSGCRSANPCQTSSGTYQSYSYDLAGNLTCYGNGISSTPGAGANALSFSQSFDQAGRLQSVTSSWSDTTHPASIFSSPSYAPPGALTNATYGNGINLARTFNGQLLPTSETDKANSAAAATAGSATVTITGTEQSK
jgi:YD repeat-containing protein